MKVYRSKEEVLSEDIDFKPVPEEYTGDVKSIMKYLGFREPTDEEIALIAKAFEAQKK